MVDLVLSRTASATTASTARELHAVPQMDINHQCVIENQSQLGIRRVNLLPLMGIALWVEEGDNCVHPLQCPQPYITVGLMRFAKCVLVLVREVFKLPTSSIHIVWEDTKRLAFNSQCSLFFNLRYAEELMQSPTIQPSTMLDFWYPVVCHELAHNCFAAHNGEHSRATEAIMTARLPIFSFVRQQIKHACDSWEAFVQAVAQS